MPFRVFLIPVLYGEDATEELNAFIASHRIAHIERKWIDQGTQSAWAFCVEYMLASPALSSNPRSQISRNRIDYKTILSPDEFTIFSLLRELRKELSQQEGVPVFVVRLRFTAETYVAYCFLPRGWSAELEVSDICVRTLEGRRSSKARTA
jgi:hypothetical protein